MPRPTDLKNRQGSILVFCVWVIFILAFFSVGLAINVRQKATAYLHLQERETFRNQAESVIKKYIYDFVRDYRNRPAISRKEWYHNGLGSGSVRLGTTEIEFELSDENDKININSATVETLERLLNNVANQGEESASRLAYAIADFRDEDDFISQYGDQGGSEKEAYLRAGLDHGPKNAPFEYLSELLLVKGMTQEIFNAIEKYICVYGNQGANINTADPLTLYAIDFQQSLVEKILSARKGRDGKEGTDDDFVFEDENKIQQQLADLSGLSEPESVRLSTAISHGFLTVNSEFFRLTAVAKNANGMKRRYNCVFGVNSGIRYWVEN